MYLQGLWPYRRSESVRFVQTWRASASETYREVFKAKLPSQSVSQRNSRRACPNDDNLWNGHGALKDQTNWKYLEIE